MHFPQDRSALYWVGLSPGSCQHLIPRIVECLAYPHHTGKQPQFPPTSQIRRTMFGVHVPSIGQLMTPVVLHAHNCTQTSSLTVFVGPQVALNSTAHWTL